MNVIRPSPALLKFACLACVVSISIAAGSQDRREKSSSVTTLLRQMTGTWHVTSRMWPAADAKAVDLPPAVARRELVRDAFLQEVMEPDGKAAGAPFTRIAYYIFNPINQQYEYVSLDSRLPQMMSYSTPGANKIREGTVELSGASFVAPEWGGKKNVPFMYRLTVGPVESGSQTVRLFLTEQNGEGDEFMAFEYIYSH